MSSPAKMSIQHNASAARRSRAETTFATGNIPAASTTMAKGFSIGCATTFISRLLRLCNTELTCVTQFNEGDCKLGGGQSPKSAETSRDAVLFGVEPGTDVACRN